MPLLNVAVSEAPGVGSRLDPAAVAVTSCVELTVVPSYAVSRKLTMGAPPFAPTVQLTVAAESSGAAETGEGAAGTVFAASAAVLSPSEGRVAAATTASTATTGRWQRRRVRARALAPPSRGDPWPRSERCNLMFVPSLHDRRINRNERCRKGSPCGTRTGPARRARHRAGFAERVRITGKGS